MLIAIDFDDTLTRDAELWRQFITSAKRLGHRCVCVTARRDTERNIEFIDEWLLVSAIDIPVYYSSLGSKVDYMESLELKVDIWIDDSPRTCALGH